MKRIFLFAIVAFSFASCQKEIDWMTPSSTGTSGNGSTNQPTGELLTKSEVITGTDTMTTLYTYDAQKRLETTTQTGKSAGISLYTYMKYVRDANGRIIQTKQKVETAGFSLDTVFLNVHYPNATTLNWDYTVSETSFMGLTSKDSTIPVNNSTRITGTKKYTEGLLGPYELSMEQLFTYDNLDRVNEQKIVEHDATTGTTDTIFYKFTHDNNITNPTYYTSSPAQNYLINQLPDTKVYVTTKMEVTSVSTPAANLTLTQTYITGQGGKPVSGTQTQLSQGTTTQSTIKFFY